MRRWIKIGRLMTAEGTTITYRLEGTPYTVESRKRYIPHANRSGTWAYTSYFVLKDGVEVVEKHSLGFAKEYADEMLTRDTEVKET